MARSQLSLDLGGPPAQTRPGEVESWARRLRIHPLLGVDEAGRGPLAGPVVAAAVSLPKDRWIRGLNDSKQVTENQREQLFDRVHAVAETFGVGVVCASTIDEIGIAAATFRAMTEAIAQALLGGLEPHLVVVDGRQLIPDLVQPQRAIIKGDGRSWNIAAASILAKVTRDRMLLRYHEQYPQYGFDRHKGYGTAVHLEALKAHGPCPIHRHSFRPVAVAGSKVPK